MSNKSTLNYLAAFLSVAGLIFSLVQQAVSLASKTIIIPNLFLDPSVIKFAGLISILISASILLFVVLHGNTYFYPEFIIIPFFKDKALFKKEIPIYIFFICSFLLVILFGTGYLWIGLGSNMGETASLILQFLCYSGVWIITTLIFSVLTFRFYLNYKFGIEREEIPNTIINTLAKYKTIPTDRTLRIIGIIRNNEVIGMSFNNPNYMTNDCYIKTGDKEFYLVKMTFDFREVLFGQKVTEEQINSIIKNIYLSMPIKKDSSMTEASQL